MTDNKRIVYCLKLWVKKIQKEHYPSLDKAVDINAVCWVIDMCKNGGIFDGTYCDDDEYNEYLITGEV